MSAVFRPVEPEDWPALLSLWVEAWSALLPTIDFQSRVPWFRGYVTDLQDQGAEVWVAAVTSDPVGFMTVNAAKQDMDQLATARGAQRQGVGRRLLRLAKTRSPSGLGLKVVQVNHPAIGLYRSEGFVVTGEGVSERSGLPSYAMRWPGFREADRDQPRSSAR